jgi:hypothetical protein
MKFVKTRCRICHTEELFVSEYVIAKYEEAELIDEVIQCDKCYNSKRQSVQPTTKRASKK